MFSIQNFGFDPSNASRKDQKTGEQVYFDGSKKNQLNDLKKYMKSIVSDPDKEYYRKEVIKKVISYTTAGVDTSRLYPEIVLASATKDPVQKKLVYLYLSIYSSTNQNFARMAINTFQKDLSNSSPAVRALALRSLTNLRFSGREQYALPACHNGLGDFSPSVKRVAVMGLAKLSVEQIRKKGHEAQDEQMLGKLYELLREEDSSVVCNALEAINEIQQEGLSMSRKLAFYLISNLHRYNDLQFPVVANYLQLYDPKDDQEVIDILTALEPRLRSSNASTVLAISKVFVKLGKQREDLLPKLLKTLRKSLLSFLHHEVSEIEWVVLRHIQFLVLSFGNETFINDYKYFYLGGKEVTYIKATKMHILHLLANSNNFSDIINEFAQYLFDEDCSNVASNCLASLLSSAGQAERRLIAKTVVKTIETAPLASICNHAFPLVISFLRLHPKQFSLFTNVFYLLADNAKEEESRASLLELIGDFGQNIEDAPELLQLGGAPLSDKLRLSQLRASVKLFLKRPSEMKEYLGKLLKATFSDDETHLQIKDYAAYLYRGLQSGVEEFKSTFMEQRPHTVNKPIPPEQLEFNTLEVIFGTKEEKWGLDPSKYIEAEGQILEEVPLDAQDPEPARQIFVDMTSRFKKLEVENFDVTFSMSSEAFEECWEEYEVGSSITRMVNSLDELSEEVLDELFKMWNIIVLASAETEEEIKFYNYCKVQTEEKDLGLACMECCFSKLAQTMTLMIKCEDEELAGFVSRYVEQIFKVNQII